MRISFVLPPVGFGGGMRVLASYAQGLRARGHDVTVTAPAAPRTPMKYQVKDFLHGKGWRRWSPRNPSHFDGTSVDVRLLDRHRPVTADDLPDADVVIATWWETAEWVAALPERCGVKVYFIQHDERALTPRKDRVEATWRLPMHRIVVASWIAQLIERHSGGRSRTVENGVDTAHFNAPPRDRSATPTVGMIHAPEIWKGSDIAWRAIETARGTLADLRVVAFGPQAPVPIDTLSQAVTFHLSPSQPMIPRLYAQCDAWLFASRYEGYGLPILEAMACRTPVIAVPAGAAPQLVNDAVGRLIPAEDPAAMAQAIVALMRQPDQAWRAMSQQARQIAEAHAMPDAVAQFESALGDAVRQGFAAGEGAA